MYFACLPFLIKTDFTALTQRIGEKLSKARPCGRERAAAQRLARGGAHERDSSERTVVLLKLCCVSFFSFSFFFCVKPCGMGDLCRASARGAHTRLLTLTIGSGPVRPGCSCAEARAAEGADLRDAGGRRGGAVHYGVGG